MFDENIQQLNADSKINNKYRKSQLKNIRQQRALRFTDMQQVVNAKLMASQQSVDNAENYPSTWTTNPDGGANGQV
jgi:surface antigen